MQNWLGALDFEFSDLIVAIVLKHLQHIRSLEMQKLKRVLSPAAYNREIGSIRIKAARRIGHTTAWSRLGILLEEDYHLIFVVSSPSCKRHFMRLPDCNIEVCLPGKREFKGMLVDDRTIILVDNASVIRRQDIDTMLDGLSPAAFILLG